MLASGVEEEEEQKEQQQLLPESGGERNKESRLEKQSGWELRKGEGE